MNAHASESNRLAAYAALSAAVAATGAASAAVQIVTLTPPVTAPSAGSARLNIGGPIFAAPGSTWFLEFHEQGGTVLSVHGTRGGGKSVSILTPLLGNNAMVSNGAGAFTNSTSVIFASTLFAPTKYVGFRAWSTSAVVHYGWLEFTLSSGDYTISRWAYEDQVGVGLLTPGSPSAVPGGAGLAALAISAAGLRGRRRSRG